jgi:hypothetical protein
VSEEILATVVRCNETKPFASLNHLTLPVAISFLVKVGWANTHTARHQEQNSRLLPSYSILKRVVAKIGHNNRAVRQTEWGGRATALDSQILVDPTCPSKTSSKKFSVVRK